MIDRRPLSEADLRDAIEHARFHARYQPIVEMADKSPVGLEVLARLDHPTLGALPPDAFVPRLESAGLAWPLTRAIIDIAFRDWQSQDVRRFGLYLALNFPLDVLLMPEAIDFLSERRETAKIAAKDIVIELTESRPIERKPDLSNAIARLRAEGYGLAIDDVGPELRDPRDLIGMKFTTLKLDKDIVRESPDSETAKDFLARTIAAARAHGLLVIAEGVEDTEIWDRMKGLGVDQAQGFLIARPLLPRSIERWRKTWLARSVT